MQPGPLDAQVNCHLLNTMKTLAKMALTLRLAACVYDYDSEKKPNTSSLAK